MLPEHQHSNLSLALFFDDVMILESFISIRFVKPVPLTARDELIKLLKTITVGLGKAPQWHEAGNVDYVENIGLYLVSLLIGATIRYIHIK